MNYFMNKRLNARKLPSKILKLSFLLSSTSLLTGCFDFLLRGLDDPIYEDVKHFGTDGDDVMSARENDWPNYYNDTFHSSLGADEITGNDYLSNRDLVDYSNSNGGIILIKGDASQKGGHAEGDVIKGIDHIIGSNFNDVIRGFKTVDGGDGDDEITGTKTQYNQLIGGKGNDTLMGGDFRDNLVGGEGDDTLIGGKGDDDLDGGAGKDVLKGGGGSNSIKYSNSDAAIKVDLALNTISGGHGEGDVISNFDHVIGSDFADVLKGNKNENRLSGNDGDDVIYGFDGDDILNGDKGHDKLYGGAGDDYLFGGLGDDQLYGGDGDDYLGGGLGENVIDGGNGIDTARFSYVEKFEIDLTKNAIKGSDGEVSQMISIEKIDFEGNNSTIRGNEKNNQIEFDGNLIKAWGGDGDDLLISYNRSNGEFKNVILGEAGNDKIILKGGSHLVDGGVGDDRVFAFDNDSYYGVKNQINGGDGADTLFKEQLIFGGSIIDEVYGVDLKTG